MSKGFGKEIAGAIKRSYIFLLLLLTVAIVGYEYYRVFISNPEMKEWQLEKFQNTFLEKEREAQTFLDQISSLVQDKNIDKETKVKLFEIRDRIYKRGGMFCIYFNDSLAFWSSNYSKIPKHFSTSFGKESKSLVLGNATYYALIEPDGKMEIVYLMKVQDNFVINNDYLQNGIQKDFKLGGESRLSTDHCLNCSRVYNLKGERVFSIDLDESVDSLRKNYQNIFFYIVLTFLLLLFVFQIVFTRHISDHAIKNVVTIFWIGFLVVVRLMLMNFSGRHFQSLKLFSPSLFAASDFLYSLGDLALHAIFLFVMVVLVYDNLSIVAKKERSQNAAILNLKFLILISIVFTLILWSENIFRSVIGNSNISFEIHKVLNTNRYTYIALSCILSLFISVVILFDKLIVFYREVFSKRRLTLLLAISFVLYPLPAYLYLDDLLTSVFILMILGLIYFFRQFNDVGYNIPRTTLLILLFSIFSVYFINKQVSLKHSQDKKVLAGNLSIEHDYIAEMLLMGIGDSIVHDTIINHYRFGQNDGLDELKTHIKSSYFSGYLNKYNVEIIVCDPMDSILIEPDNVYFHCYDFFSDYINEQGSEVPNTYFYFMDNNNGRIGYLGSFVIRQGEWNEYGLYIELMSKLMSAELGYPELLLDKEGQNTSVLKNYSYAKYYKGFLIAKSGEYQYSLKDDFEGIEDFKELKINGYSHVYYFPNSENAIVISSPLLKPSDLLFTLSYLFLFNMLGIGFVFFLYRLNYLEKLFVPTFRNKIQFSIMFVLIISLVFIGSLTIYYSIGQYENKHHEFISEKLSSVKIELEHKLGNEYRLTGNWSSADYENLDALLRKFSNVFFTDIHLYDPGGQIMASSRPEIFANEIQGSHMNPEAFYELAENSKGEFIHSEQVGSLKYLSGYVPFFSNSDKLLAYLNLPYFTRQKNITAEITSLGITIINIYVLLFIISTIMAFVMSEQLTRPLKLIQESFRKVKLGKQNEPIDYSSTDEITGLVNEYNRMVVELSQNAEKLAKSEREMAWREMARQIAHEIKNPLTPMKLNIQQLQRAWKDKNVNMDELLSKVTTTLIEQINALSSIATEFSNFAKIPQSKNEVVNVVLVIKNTVQLFGQTENVTFSVNYNNIEEANIYADKEQVMRVFTNLLKNAIQSILESRKGIVSIDLKTDHDGKMVNVQIKDNGRGIPEEIHSRLFQPNFTTKSGGMGLGLSIVKKIMDTSNGTISFESKINKGTCFTLEWERFY